MQLKQADLHPDDEVCWSDEMRLGLIGQVRRRWVPSGFKLVQPLQFVYEWEYLLLAINPITGHLRWDWIDNLKSACLVEVVEEWLDEGLKALIWDRARGHRGAAWDEVSLARISQPAYSPELNPVERIFEFLRDKVEGEVYASLAAKREAVDTELRQLAADPQAVQRIAGWDWILDALSARAA